MLAVFFENIDYGIALAGRDGNHNLVRFGEVRFEDMNAGAPRKAVVDGYDGTSDDHEDCSHDDPT